MEVARYTFQSPYSSPVQVGRPDPSVKKEQPEQKTTNQDSPATKQTANKADAFTASIQQEVKTTVTTTEAQKSAKTNHGQQVSSANRAEQASSSSKVGNSGSSSMGSQMSNANSNHKIDVYA